MDNLLTQAVQGFVVMIDAFLILLAMAVALYIVAYRRHDGSDRKSLNIGVKTLKNLLPLLVLAFLAAGLIQVVIPPSLIKSWLGQESGWKGILIATGAGMILPGGPYVAFPLIGSIFAAGASLPAAVAFVTAWAVANINNIPYEVALVSPRFTVARYTIVLPFPLLAGFITQLIT